MEEKTIYTELSTDELKNFQDLTLASSTKSIIIIKFSAEWCGPCKKIKPLCEDNFGKMPNNVIIFDLDIDHSLDLYATLKGKKMVRGVPCLLCYYLDVKPDYWYIPDDSISGSDKKEVQAFFDRCVAKASSLV